MATAKQLITLQLGSYSNSAGSSFWNIETDYAEKLQRISRTDNDPDSIDVRYLLRECPSGSAPTYVPRCVCVDLTGRFKSSLESVESDAFQSVAEVNMQAAVEHMEWFRQEPVGGPSSKSVVCDMYHPRSIVPISGETCWKNGSSTFLSFNQGEELWGTDSFVDSMEYSLRFFAEECDDLDGFMVVQDSMDGFGGVASGLLQYLSDEYHRKARFNVSMWPGLEEQVSLQMRCRALMNICQAITKNSEHSSLYSLWGFGSSYLAVERPNVTFAGKTIKEEEVPGLFAGILSAMTRPWRLEKLSNGLSLNNYCSDLAARTKLVVPGVVTFPENWLAMHTVFSYLDQFRSFYEAPSYLPCSPVFRTPGHVFSQLAVLCGQGYPNPAVFAQESRKYSWRNVMSNFGTCSPQTILDYYLGYNFQASCNISFSVAAPLTVPRCCFESTVLSLTHQVPAMVSLTSSSGLFPAMKDLIDSLRKYSPSILSLLSQESSGRSTIEECSDGLLNLADSMDYMKCFDML